MLKDYRADCIPKKIYSKDVMSVDRFMMINQRLMGGGMSQNVFAPFVLEWYIEANGFDYVAELGSQKGALSVYLGTMACITESFLFETFEINKAQDWSNKGHEGAGHWFEKMERICYLVKSYEMDVFNPNAIAHIHNKIQEYYQAFIFCDGGNKVEEFKIYSKLLKPGDCIAVHDWNDEIHQYQIQDAMNENKCFIDEPFATSASNLKTKIMFFKKA